MRLPVPRSCSTHSHRWITALVAAALGCGKVTPNATPDAVEITPDAPADTAVDASIDATTDAPPDARYTQRRWELRAGASQPGPLFAPRLVYDEARRTVIMYGGFSGPVDASTPSAAMWELTASGWQKLCDPCDPGPRVYHAMAYDPVRDRIVLYGGTSNGTTGVDTVFEWDGAWTQTTTTGPTGTPGARELSSLVYDLQHSRMLLFGGEGPDDAPLDDVWSYAAGAWTRLPSASTSPKQLAGAGTATAYDPARGILALRDDDETGRDDLWAWNNGWTQVCTACSARPRISASLVYDPTLATTYLINGYDTSMNDEIDGTWRFDGTKFMKMAEDPRGRDSEGVVYDAARDVIVLYGGNGRACAPEPANCAETWELVPDLR